MKCHSVKNYLSAYLDKELTEADYSLISSHLDKCSTCQEYFQVMREQNIWLRKMAEVPVPQSDSEKATTRWRQLNLSSKKLSHNWWTYWRYAVAPLSAVAILLVIYFFPIKQNFRYYSIDGSKVPILEAALPENLLKYQLGVILTDLNNSLDEESLNYLKDQIVSLDFLSNISREKLKAEELHNEKKYRFYMQLEIILLNLLNESSFNPQELAGINL